MNPFTVHRGRVAPLDRVNVDTDQIIPKQFLKRIERRDLASLCFTTGASARTERKIRISCCTSHAMRAPAFWSPERISAADLRASMRCGRLADFGFRAVISSSFADIFANNSTKNGFLTVRLSDEEVAH